MMTLIEANWVVFALALLIGLAVAWWLFGRASTAPKRERRPDVLDEGAAPAQRNQALIDAPPAAQIVPPAFGGIMGGVAEAVAIGAQDVVEEAAAAAPQPVAGDDLSKIKGLGPKMQALLPTLGISTYAQIAALTDADMADLDTKLGAFAGRPKRDNWVEQAKHLAAGDVAGFEAQFGKL